MSTGSGVHAGHRQRMKERFLTCGLEGFSDHEIFELILFYAIPRKDVNELSHRLIEKFGSYQAVFDADYEDICSVEGIGENAAILIKLMVCAWRRYALGDKKAPFIYDTLEKIGEYAVKLYVGVSVEKVYAMLFDNKMKLLDTVMIAEGAVNSVHIPTRTIIDKAIKKNAASIILIHNHPNGITYPSKDDIMFSSYLKDLLATLDITLVDHIIVSGCYYRPVFEGNEKVKRLAASKNFSYGDRGDVNGIRVFEPRVASDIPFDGNTTK